MNLLPLCIAIENKPNGFVSKDKIVRFWKAADVGIMNIYRRKY